MATWPVASALKDRVVGWDHGRRVDAVAPRHQPGGHVEPANALAAVARQQTPAILGEGEGADFSLVPLKRLQPASLMPQQTPLEAAQVFLIRPRPQRLEQGP